MADSTESAMAGGAGGSESDRLRRPVRVLLVEDDEDDYLLTSELLREIGQRRYTLDWTSTFHEAVSTMAQREHDVYLVDYRLDGHDGLELLRGADRLAGPVIVLTGLDDRDVDLRAMEAGAADYLVKGQIDAPLLERSIRYAIQRRRSEEALRRAHDELERRVQERTIELRMANEELRERVAQQQRTEDALRESERRKDEFLAMLAHELRNPLAPVRNALHILKMPEAGVAAVRQARDMMERQVQHLVRLVDDLLDVSRIMRGKIELRKETVDLAAVVGRAVETAQPALDAAGHELSLTLPARPVLLEADVVRLAQVFANLLNNAAKYTEPAGRVWLEAERDGPGAVLVRVRDTGIGITPDLLPHIFEPFVQADRSLARSQGGLGIGLTLVKKLVEMHGGTVTAASAGPGRGSEFGVWLPALPESRAEAEGGEPIEAIRRAGPGRRVLVVDDNVDAAQSAAMLLRIWGHEVRTAHDGSSVFGAVRDFRPEVVLLDIGLPGMSGFEVARQLRREQEFRGLVLAAMTGYGQDEDRRKSREAGFDVHLTKPLDPDTLAAFVTSPELFMAANP